MLYEAPQHGDTRRDALANRLAATGMATMPEHAHQAQSKPVISATAAELFVADIKASCDFFTQRLGFAIVFVYGEPPFYAQVQRDGARLNLRRVDAPLIDSALRERESLLSVSISVATADEIKMLFLELQSAGVVFHQTLKAE